MTKQKIRNRKEKIREKNLEEVTNAFVKRCFRGYRVFVTTYNKQFSTTFGTVFDLTKVK